MADSWQSFLLGIVQGLTEFLPISSSAHLILVPRVLHWMDQGLAFDVALRLGALTGVVAYFWKDLVSFWKPSERKMWLQIALATLPGALLGLTLEHKIETVFRSPALIACTLMGVGILLGLADRLTKGDKTIQDLTWKTALLLGVAQACALVPGVSRSGITITTALFLGLSRTHAARISFLMAIPITAGAGLLKSKEILMTQDPTGVAIGFAAAAISGFLAIWGLLRYVQTNRYTPFVVYRLILGVLILLNLGRLQ